MMQNERDLLTPVEAMDYLQIGRTRLYQYVSNKKLTRYRKPDIDPHLTFFKRAELDAIKQSKENPIVVSADELDASRAGR